MATCAVRQHTLDIRWHLCAAERNGNRSRSIVHAGLWRYSISLVAPAQSSKVPNMGKIERGRHAGDHDT